jgi:hypothetical protein
VRNDRSWANNVWRRVVPPAATYWLWNTLTYTPGLCEVYLKSRPEYRVFLPTSATAIAIEGFPRSANTYAREAFKFANPSVGPVSSHLHTPRAIELAVKHGVPSIVLIRDPAFAVTSMIQFAGDVDVRRTLNGYCRFYKRVKPLLAHVVLADFAQVTKDFGQVITRCNQKFGTDFVPYIWTPEAEEEVAKAIEQAAAVIKADNFENMVSRPSSKRNSAEEFLKTLTEGDHAALHAASQLYQELLEEAGALAST